MSWSEEAEKLLMKSVDWVDDKFPGEDGKNILSHLGGKWEVVAKRLGNEFETFKPTGSACKTKFYQIRSREVHTVNQNGQQVIIAESTEFPQAVLKDEDLVMAMVNPRLATLEKKVDLLEKQLKEKDKVLEIVQNLNDSFQEFFQTYK